MTMIKCDDAMLDVLLDTDEKELHSIADLAEVAQHVESCTYCQTRLSELAAADHQWQEVYQVLSPGELSMDAYAESLDARERWKRPTAWTDAMAKSLLSAPSHPEMLGRIGRYDVERLIGTGGMGVVFKAYDTELNRPVAVKLLAPYLAENGSARKRFAREARAAAAVVDEHVVAIHNVETGDGVAQPPFLVMKYIGGGSLQQRLDRDGPLDVCEILRIGMQTAKGLVAAHAQGLIHRDVKPSNILLDEGVDRALLTDFGLARAENDACLTRSGFHPGTPHYMSPEQVRGEAIDGRSDLFSLGCVLYALCTGHPPFRAETSYAVLRRITDDTARPIREINPNIPQWLEAIVMKLLSKSPEDRFDSANMVAEVLEDCLAHVQHPLTTSLPECVAATLPDRGSLPPWSKLVAVAAFGFSIIFAGILIVLETNKGTLTIESDVDDVPIRIMQGDKVVERLTVTRAGETTRIAAGNYVVSIDGGFASLTVSGNATLTRGSKATVKIEKSAHDLGVANTNVNSLLDQSVDSGTVRPVPGSEARKVNDVANAKWGDGEPLQVARRVFAARRQLLSDFQLSYRTISMLSENSDQAAEHSTLPENASDVGLEALANKSTQAEAKHGSGIVTIGFAGSTVYYYDRPSKKGEPATGWIYDGQTMIRLQSVSDNEPLQVVADAATVPDFSGLFGVEPNPLQFAGLLAMSQNTVPYIDNFLDEESDVMARWVLRETGSYATPRPWIPGCDRMLLIEFNCTIPVLSQTESGKSNSFVLPVRLSYVLDAAYDYWPIWYQTQTQFGTKAFRTTCFEQRRISDNTVYFPTRINGEAEDAYGFEVTDWTMVKSVNLKTVFGDAAPNLTIDEQKARQQKAEDVSYAFGPTNSAIQPNTEPSKSGSSPESENKIRDILSTIDALNQREDTGPNSYRSQRWGFELKALVSCGSDAVPSIIREIDQTRDDRMIATLAFALRAIGDKRGVPALIRAIPRTSVPLTNCNWIFSRSKFDEDLVAFFQGHRFAGQGDAAIGCSDAPTELSHALQELTGQTFGFSRTFGIGMPGQIYLQQKTLQRDAQRWADWWEANSGTLVADADYRKVDLAPLKLKQADPVDAKQVLARAFWKTENQLQALQIVADANEQARVSFLDLDTGRSMPVPEKWRTRQLSASDHTSLMAWADGEGFDLVCDRYQMDEGRSHYALLLIGAKAWQLPDRRWEGQSEYASLDELTSEGREVAGDWLLPRSDETDEIDPTATAPFLVMTRDGSPVLVCVGAEVTELAQANEMIEFDDLHRPTGFVHGRKLAIQTFEPIEKK